MPTPALWALLFALGTSPAPALPSAAPAEVGLDPARLARIDAVVESTLAAKQAPGAVVLIARKGKVVFRKAYGLRSVRPTEEKMTVDTVFDLASLTKPLATGLSVMALLEDGKLSLSDRVTRFRPDFGRQGKDTVTLEHLLLHTSGLIADNALGDYAGGPVQALEKIDNLRLQAQPGTRFTYSDVGYIVLGSVVEKVSGQTLDAFARERFWKPLGLKDTDYRPRTPPSRVAPTQQVNGRWLRGEVHDPRARAMGGVAGHAGLFGTADDLAVIAQMLLDGGKTQDGKKILAPSTVKTMTTPRPVPRGQRTYGWDARTSYSGNAGALFDGFGHTGFTGTSLWVDPASQMIVVVLTNRVHPDGKGNVGRLRSQIANLAAESIVAPPYPPRKKKEASPEPQGK